MKIRHYFINDVSFNGTQYTVRFDMPSNKLSNAFGFLKVYEKEGIQVFVNENRQGTFVDLTCNRLIVWNERTLFNVLYEVETKLADHFEVHFWGDCFNYHPLGGFARIVVKLWRKYNAS